MKGVLGGGGVVTCSTIMLELIIATNDITKFQLTLITNNNFIHNYIIINQSITSHQHSWRNLAVRTQTYSHTRTIHRCLRTNDHTHQYFDHIHQRL